MPPDGRTVLHHISAAKDRLRDADIQLGYLAAATDQLHHPADAAAKEVEVRSPFLAWLVFARQVSGSIQKAWETAGRPLEFKDWWDSLEEDERHLYFWRSRNDGLRWGDPIMNEVPIVDAELGAFGYFAFADGPFKGDPLMPRCQQYTEWLYKDCLCVAQDKLYDYFRDDAIEAAKDSPLGR